MKEILTHLEERAVETDALTKERDSLLAWKASVEASIGRMCALVNGWPEVGTSVVIWDILEQGVRRLQADSDRLKILTTGEVHQSTRRMTVHGDNGDFVASISRPSVEAQDDPAPEERGGE